MLPSRVCWCCLRFRVAASLSDICARGLSSEGTRRSGWPQRVVGGSTALLLLGDVALSASSQRCGLLLARGQLRAHGMSPIDEGGWC